MSGKYRSKLEFEKLVEKFFAKAKELGRDEIITKEVWRQVSSFAGYSFSKAHSASFAVESYQSLYLKTYFPQEFMVAVLNNYGGFYSRWLYVHELKKTGADVHLPCVNNSETTVIIKGEEVYLGFVGISGLENKFIEKIPAERKANGPYQDLENFIHRTSISLEQCIILIRVNAFRFTGRNKKELLWDVHGYIGQKYAAKMQYNGKELFHLSVKEYSLPELPEDPLENAYQELELLGFTLTLSLFDLLRTSKRETLKAKELMSYVGQTVRIMGNFVTYKDVTTKNEKRMWFGTFLDLEGTFFDTVHFPNNTPSYPFRGAGCYLIQGKVVEDFGYPAIEVLKFAKLPILDNPIIE